MSKDSAHSPGHDGHFFPQKYCVACMKSMFKVQINISFVTSNDHSHYSPLFLYIYGAQIIQWFCIQNINTFTSTVFLIDEVSDVAGLTPIAIKQQELLTPNSPYLFCASADFEIKYCINQDIVGVMVNTELIFYD